ncbi:MAG: TRAP transporter substrate-binding protein [Candidatus Rokubacteria bacterium]|nr:TRAP transporter substrate-binding protein [Candidatus Rokubacteria bacterium]
MNGRIIKRSLLVIAAVAVAGLLSVPPLPAQTGGKIVLRFPHIQPATDPVGQTSTDLAELVAKKTNNRVEIKIYPAGQMGGEKEILEGIILGTFDMSFLSTAIKSSVVPEFGLFDLPFVFRDHEHAYKVMDGPVAADLGEMLLKRRGLRVLTWWEVGFRDVFSKRGPVRTAEDFKGLKIRSPQAEVFMKTFQALGGVPTPVPWPEVYNALQTNIVDAAETSLAYGHSNKWYEVTKYASKTRHIFTAWSLDISDRVYRGLPADVQTALREAAREATVRHRERTRTYDAQAEAKLKAAGMTLNEVDQASLRALVQPVWKEIGGKVAGGPEILKRIQDTR